MLITLIKPNPNNPRKIDKADFDKLVKSIQDDPKLLNAKPLIIDENNIILGGNQRYKACLQLGIQDVPVIVMSNLSEREKRKLLVIDNTHYGFWDMDMLANEDWSLNDLDDWGVNVDFLAPTNKEPENIDNTKGGKICPNCGVSL
jgi:ParB-like chromosome segregation protein Spo0J